MFNTVLYKIDGISSAVSFKADEASAKAAIQFALEVEPLADSGVSVIKTALAYNIG